MDTQLFIPAIDPIPLPAPFWLFKILLVVTFVLHIVAMNFMLGSGVLAFFAKLRSAQHENYQRLFGDVTKKIPSLLAATVTLGIAPLLFLQVLYGQFFYTSSVIIGWPWFLVVILVTLAYYGFYLVSFKQKALPGVVGWVLLLSIFMIFAVGFIYSNNITLMSSPENWSGKYHADPSGWNLNLGEQTLIPRYLHFMLASVAIGGLFVTFIGLFRWHKDRDYAKFLITFGGKAFTYVTMVQLGVGMWFLVSLPRAKMMLFMGDNMLATIALMVGMTGGLGAIFIMSDTLRQEDPRKGVYLTSAVIGVVIVFMVIMRETLRDAYLAEYIKPEQFVVQTQWGVMILFFVCFVAGIGLWALMLKRYFFSPQLRTEQ